MVIAPGPRDEDASLSEQRPTSPNGSRLVRVAGPSLPYDRSYHLLRGFGKIRDRVRDQRPDVLEAHSPYLAAAAVLMCGRRWARLTTAFWHCDHLGVHVESRLTRHLGARCGLAAALRLRRGVRALLAPFDATFVAGRLQAERLRQAGVPRVIHTPFGIDKRIFQPGAQRDETRRQWLGDAPAGAALLVGVGRLAGEKRWDVVLDAFARLRARRPAVLVLFGDGPERPRLERRSPPGVRFAGFEPDRARLAGALASADLLVHAAPYETFGLALAEAVACGLPLVVPAAGAAPEHASLGCSQTYPSLDASACATAIEDLLRRPADALRIRALQAAERMPTTEQHFDRVLRAYDDLLRELRR